MKLATHYTFTIGLVALAARPLLPIGWALAIATWLGLFVNSVIDKAGHEARGGITRRTVVTHSIPGAVGVGVAAGVLPVALAALLAPGALASAGIQGVGIDALIALMAALGAIAGLSHLFLDALTEGGIYYRGRRWAIAHWRYDCAAANMPFALLGLLMLAGAMVGL